MKKLLLFLLLALLLVTPALAVRVTGPDGAVYERPDVVPAEEPAQLFAAEDSVTQNGVIYTLSGGEAQVAGYTADIPAVCALPEAVNVSGTSYPVTALADNAFYNCSRLTSLTLPESVTGLGSRSLAGCTGLRSIRIPAGVATIRINTLEDCSSLVSITVDRGNEYYYSDGRSLFDNSHTLVQYALNSGTSYTVPEGCEAIGDRAFENAANLRSVDFPDSVLTIGYSAFENCRSLSRVTFGQGLTTIRSGAFASCSLTRVDLPAGIVCIGQNAFLDCPVKAYTVAEGGDGPIYAAGGVLFSREYQLDSTSCSALIAYPSADTRTGYAIPEGIRCVGYGAFWDAENLERVVFPADLTCIESGAFTGTGLTEVTIPDTVTELGGYIFQVSKLVRATLGAGVAELPGGLFSGCSYLEEVTIPKEVTRVGVGESIFQSCSSLQAVHVEEGNPSYKDMDGALYSKDGTHLILCPAAVTAVHIPASVTEIDPGAFRNCSGMSAITVAEDNEVFYAQADVLFQREEDGSVTLHTYPAGKTDSSYTVPAGVTRIGEQAFGKNPHLTRLNTSDVTEIGNAAVEYTRALKQIDLPQIETLGQTSLVGFQGTAIEFPATLKTVGQQAMDFNYELEYVTFTGDVPTFEAGFMGNGDALRYVYVPAGMSLAYKDALAQAELKAGVMIVEGSYVSRDALEAQIGELTASSDAAAVNAAAQGVVRLLTSQQEELSDANLTKVDRLFREAHTGLSVQVDQEAVTDAALTVQGLALASGLVEQQDETGAVTGEVTLTAVEEETGLSVEPLSLDLTMTVDGVAAQPKSPVVITVDLPQTLAGKEFKLFHVDGWYKTEVPVSVSGNNATFRATSFSSYVFRLPNDQYLVNYTAPDGGTLFIAGYQNGQMKTIQGLPASAGTAEVEFDGQEGLIYKAFLLGDHYVPVGKTSVILPD